MFSSRRVSIPLPRGRFLCLGFEVWGHMEAREWIVPLTNTRDRGPHRSRRELIAEEFDRAFGGE